MSRLEAMRDRTRQQLEAAEQRQQESTRQALSYLLAVDPGPLPPPPDLAAQPNLQARAAVYDAWVEQRVALFRGQPSQSQPAAPESPPAAGTPAPGPETASTGVSAPVCAAPRPVEEWLGCIDQAMLADFDLGRFSLPAGLTQPTKYIEKPAEYYRAVAEGLGFAEAQRREVVRTPPAALCQSAALHLPGVGCLVNGGLFPPEALGFSRPGRVSEAHDPQRLLQLLRSVAGAKWADGFLAEFTPQGQNLVTGGWWRLRQASALGLSPALDEAAAERLRLLDQGQTIAACGWKEWLWEYLACKSRQPLGDGLVLERPSIHKSWETLTRVSQLFPLFIDFGGVFVQLAGIVDVLRYLFLEQTRLAPLVTNRILLEMEKYVAAQGSQVEKTFGLKLPETLGWIYCSRLEATLGTYCVPYALLIAFSAPPRAAASLAAMRQEQIDAPLMNPDARLALLAGLDVGSKYNPRGLSLAAWEKYQMDAPRQYFI